MLEYARFKEFYAKFWNVDPNTLYRVRNYSNSRQSVYLLGVHGPVTMVPVSILEFERLMRV